MPVDIPPEVESIEPYLDTSGAKVRERIRLMVRAARQAHGLTQAELGREVGTSRFAINRIEAGASDLTPTLAEQLAQVLQLAELRQLVARRDQLVPIPDRRDAVVTRLLNLPGLSRLRIVLADGLNLYPQLFTWVDEDAMLKSEYIEIVVPTTQRERELFGGNARFHGHVEYQLRRILDLKKSDHYVAGSLRIYESDEVISSVILAATRTGEECALWPSLAIRAEIDDSIAATMPVGTSVDQQTVTHLHAHIDTLIQGREPLRSNEALCRIVPRDAAASTTFPGSEFSRYFTVGEDLNEDVDDSEGFAVALVLVVALCPRKGYGIARRVIARMGSKSLRDRRRSLFSNTVEDLDLQRARAISAGSPLVERRSTKGSLAATLAINEYLESLSRVIPDIAFQLAAAREMSTYDLDFDASRFKPVPLPSELELVKKKSSDGDKRAAITPRLFVVELKTDPPELATLTAKADVSEIGVLDLMEDTNMNDFLAKARESGFLARLLADYDIAER